MIECRLREFLESNGAIGDCPAGFRRYRSTVDQVVKLTQTIKETASTESNPPLYTVLVDFKAAYDKGVASHDATQAEETGSIRKVIALGTELPLTAQHLRCRFLNSTSP
ncbi:hypothetical protein TNCV_2507851 [Trichonephila clavipes]|nr:hypothetical protein TNCV_2507851 [Trichonephila clavipes]